MILLTGLSAHHADLDRPRFRCVLGRERITGHVAGPEAVDPELGPVAVPKRIERRAVRIEEITAIGRASQ